ncbi:hypothetical protein PRZ48_007957 [Zasmidium cellare]|uniref:Uncharacterized protein n=1 Tax=Zasmidium cellare TaxID=395010 RepID=A0ABR0EE49_ZASCE|nr:hypothetical protein PRZ48_007957 [Zasmidium cellare]
MGLFDGRSYSTNDVYLNPNKHSSQHRSTSRTRGISPARSATSKSAQNGGYFARPSYARSASGGSFFNSSSRGIFSSNSNSSSYYRRRPRDGYISYLLHKLQRMIRDLWTYARRHPVKAFFAIVVPLLSAGGAIHGLMRQFGVRMPFGLDGAARRMGGGYYGSSGYGGGGGGGWMDNAGGLMQIAKAFM